MKKITLEINDKLYKKLLETIEMEKEHYGIKIKSVKKYVIDGLDRALDETIDSIREDLLGEPRKEARKLSYLKKILLGELYEN